MSRLVFFDFLFLGCRSECGWFRAVILGFTCLFRSRVILENERGQYFSTAPFLFLRVPLLRKQTVPRKTPLWSLRIVEWFFILERDFIAQYFFDFLF